MKSRVDWETIAGAYNLGRPSPSEGLAAWRRALSGYLQRDQRLVDVGSGTGQWSMALAAWFGVRVLGVEPSAEMRRVAVETSCKSVRHVGGQAEGIPVQGGCFDAAWMSTVIGQIDLAATSGELRRVLGEGGKILVREGFADRPWNRLIEQYFPSVLALAAARGVTSDEAITTFEAAGFALERLEPVEETWADSLSDAYERLRHRAGSLLVLMSDDAWVLGLRALKADAQAERESRPIVSQHDLAVFRRSAE